MATTVAGPRTFTKPASAFPGRRFDHFFFSATALLMLVTVFVGFAPTYYLAGVFRAPLPSTIIHVHGAAFSCWILLLVTQTSLVSAHRVDLHKRLGIAGFILACLMVFLGLWASTDRLARASSPPGFDPYFFYIIPTTDMVIFATLILFAFRLRRDSPAHKRIIYVATTGLLIAAIARWPWAFVHRKAPNAAVVSYAFLILLMAYDWWSTRKVHRATIWASAFLVFVQLIRLPIGKTAAWHAFAAWVQTVAR
jgi:FtsH-binding integral membrane protein